MKRSADYARELVSAGKKRLCDACGSPILKKRELLALLDEKKPKSTKAALKLLALVAAQLDGYCTRKCRKSSR
jgi:hypothetical protein